MRFEIGVPNTLMVVLTLLLGAVLSLWMGWVRGRRAGIVYGKRTKATILCPLFIAACSHLGYCLVSIPNVFYSWQFGQLFYGGLLGALLALYITGGNEKAKLMESCAPSFALMVLFARLAEGFSGQGYGEYWYEEPGFFCRFPFMTYDPYYESWGWALFMAGAAVAVIILIVLFKRRSLFDGDGMLLFFGLYASAQVVLESLRRDEFLRWGFVRVEELLSAVAILVVLIAYWVRTGRAHALQKALCMALFVSMVVFCLLLEFATEGRIPFLVFLDVWHCYALMAVACAVNAGCVLWMRRLSIPDKENVR